MSQVVFAKGMISNRETEDFLFESMNDEERQDFVDKASEELAAEEVYELLKKYSGKTTDVKINILYRIFSYERKSKGYFMYNRFLNNDELAKIFNEGPKFVIREGLKTELENLGNHEKDRVIAIVSMIGDNRAIITNGLIKDIINIDNIDVYEDKSANRSKSRME